MPNESTEHPGSTGSEETRAGEGRLLARRYRLRVQVGRGGMGTVWQAHDEVLGRDVAVKEVILPYGLSDDERAIQYKRTFREARTAARLGHPGVVTVYDVVEEDGRPWIIMELIRSRSLDQVIKEEGPLPPRRAAEIGRQMLAALHAAHEAGVLHRDVKPSNVLVDDDDRAVLTDFGIATATGDVTLTQTGLVMGSPAYIAPERARGRTIGPASDLWSLGITLYAMIDGKSPYERSEPMASLVAIISEDIEPAAGAGSLDPVIEGLLRKNPDERMNAREAGALLDEIVRQDARTVQTTRRLPAASEQPPAPRPEELPAPRPERPTARVAREEPPGANGGGTPRTAATDRGPDGGPDRGTDATYVGMGAGPTRSAERSARNPRIKITTTSVVLVIIGIALLALGLVAVQAMISGNDGKVTSESNAPTAPDQIGGTAPAVPDRIGGASSAPAPSKTVDSSGVPAGFRLHKDPTGFSIAVPEGWRGPEKRSYSPSSVFFTSPDGKSYAQVDQTSTPGSSALADWQRSSQNGPSQFKNYRQIKVAPVTEGGPITDASGKKAADWEFTHGSEPTHVLNRGLVMNGRGYAILLSAPDADWNKALGDLAPVFASFKPST